MKVKVLQKTLSAFLTALCFLLLGFFSRGSVLAQSSQQPFAPIGAKWIYDVKWSFFEDNYYKRTFEVTKDTLIDGKQCSVLEERYYGEQITGYEYLY